jgi:hypothetical protein
MSAAEDQREVDHPGARRAVSPPNSDSGPAERADPASEAAAPRDEAGGPVPAPAKRKHSKWLIALEVLTVLGVVAPFIFYAVASHTKTNLATVDLFSIELRNDRSVPLTVRTCGADCPRGSSFVVLTAGSSAQITAAANGSVTRYYLLNPSGGVVGCLPLRFTSKAPGVVLLTSQAVACPGRPLSSP